MKSKKIKPDEKKKAYWLYDAVMLHVLHTNRNLNIVLMNSGIYYTRTAYYTKIAAIPTQRMISEGWNQLKYTAFINKVNINQESTLQRSTSPISKWSELRIQYWFIYFYKSDDQTAFMTGMIHLGK